MRRRVGHTPTRIININSYSHSVKYASNALAALICIKGTGYIINIIFPAYSEMVYAPRKEIEHLIYIYEEIVLVIGVDMLLVHANGEKKWPLFGCF